MVSNKGKKLICQLGFVLQWSNSANVRRNNPTFMKFKEQ